MTTARSIPVQTPALPEAGPVVVVGRNSFLARHTLPHLAATSTIAVHHDQTDTCHHLEAGTIVSFAKHPGIAGNDYRPLQDDPDLQLAHRIRNRRLRLVMLSTRKVYAPSSGPLHESAPLRPGDAYARNKLEVECRLRDLLGERLLILRLANIFGYEREPGRRTFLGLLLERLEGESRIVFDMSPFVERDFLPAERCGEVLAHLATVPSSSWPEDRVLNVGSGIGLPTGKLALWVLEGFGRGKLVVTSPLESDPFVLDVGRLCEGFGPVVDLDALREACINIGQRLAVETEGQRRRSIIEVSGTGS